MSKPDPQLVITQQQKAKKSRDTIRKMFSDNPEVRAAAIGELKAAWSYHEPSFNVEELANMPADACTIMAAKRDGQKEIIDWITNL